MNKSIAKTGLPLLDGTVVPFPGGSAKEEQSAASDGGAPGAETGDGAASGAKRNEAPPPQEPASYAALRRLLLPGYKVFEEFIWYEKENDGGEKESRPICGMFGVIGSVSNSSGQWSLMAEVQDHLGVVRSVRISFAQIHSDARKVRAQLADIGLWISPREVKEFDQLLSMLRPSTHFTFVTGTGWYDGAFVNGDGRVFGPNPKNLLLNDPTIGGIGGTLEGQIKAYTAALETEVSSFALGICAGPGGCICNYAGLDTPVLAFTGDTSLGKTTSLKLAASAWGSLENERSCFETLRGTDNGLESALERCSGRVLALDEAQHIEGRILQKLIFMAAGGKGKIRARPDGSLRPSKTWQTFVLISSELGIASKIEAEGEKAAAGGLVRCADFDVADTPTLPKAIMEKIEAVAENYGHTGPLVAEWLAANMTPTEVRAAISKQAVELAGENGASVAKRSAMIFAVLWLCGHAYKACGVIPAAYDLDGVILKCWEKFRDSEDSLPSGAKLVSRLTTNLVSNRGGYVKEIGNDGGFKEAWAWYDETGRFYVRSDKIEALAGGTAKRSQITRELQNAGILIRSTGKNLTHKALPDGSRVQHYIVHLKKETSAHEEASDPLQKAA